MTDPKFVAFSTQKGGAGKTTLTVLVASYLYYVKGLKVLVVDCDYPQFSIEDMRQRDMDLIECSPSFKKAFAETIRHTKLPPYPLLMTAPDDAMRKVREIIEDGNTFDIVFFDLPRYCEQPGCRQYPQLHGYGHRAGCSRQGDTAKLTCFRPENTGVADNRARPR